MRATTPPRIHESGHSSPHLAHTPPGAAPPRIARSRQSPLATHTLSPTPLAPAMADNAQPYAWEHLQGASRMGGVLEELDTRPWGWEGSSGWRPHSRCWGWAGCSRSRRLIHGVERGARGSAPRCRCEEAAMVLAESGASWTSGVECGWKLWLAATSVLAPRGPATYNEATTFGLLRRRIDFQHGWIGLPDI